MKRTISCALWCCLTILAVGAAWAVATPQPVSGVVKDSAGKAAAKIEVRFWRLSGGNDDEIIKENALPDRSVIELQSKTDAFVGMVVTNVQGQFLLKPQPPGQYRYLAGNGQNTTGIQNGKFEITEDKPVKLEIQLNPPQ